MDYWKATDRFGDSFLERPMDMTMEADMQCRLVELLRAELRGEHQLWTQLPEPGLTDNGRYATYKRPYIDRVIETTPDEGTRLSRVHSEVNVSDLTGPNEQIDVVVFDQELSHPVRWNGGSKRYDERDITAAFELKFIKNQNVLSNDFDTSTLRQASEEEMHSARRVDQLHKDNRNLEHDLARLNDLPTDDTYLVIFSNYNYLFQPELLDRAGATLRKNRKVGWAVDGWLSSEAKSGSTDILYVQPGGKVWWE